MIARHKHRTGRNIVRKGDGYGVARLEELVELHLSTHHICGREPFAFVCAFQYFDFNDLRTILHQPVRLKA